MQKAGRYFLIAIASTLAIAMTLSLAPIQLALTVHSGLSSEHSSIRNGDVVNSSRGTIGGDNFVGTIFSGSGFGALYPKAGAGVRTSINPGAGYTLLNREVILVGGQETEPYTFSTPTGTGWEFVFFQNGG